jgi:transposase
MEEMIRELEEWRAKYLALESKASALMDKTAALKDETSRLKFLVKYYEEQLKHAKRKQFAASSEHPGQKILFDEAENEADRRKPEPEIEEINYTRRKWTGKREEDLSGLPVERVEHTVPEEERICPSCGGEMHVMGHDVRRELEIIPAQVRIVEHVTEVCSCRNCERNSTEVPIIKAPLPEPPIKGSIASAGTLAHIMVQKYVNAVPLYRQQQELFLNGAILSRQTMANWMIYCSERWLEPLCDLMKARLLEERVLHADETVLQVLKEPGRASRTQSYMWLYRTGAKSGVQIAIFDYQETRSSSHPKRFMRDWKGYLHTDGYAGYHSLPPDITVVGCWAHARRKFFDALKTIPVEERMDSPSRTGLEYCDRLFRLERAFKKQKLKPEERHAARLEQSRPIAGEFFSWASSAGHLPNSLFGKAIHYALEQKAYLERVFLDGRLELSNNRAERSIKPFVIGRKNWLFSCSPKGAKASSMIYSIIETAKENGLKPFEYLKHIFMTMPNIPVESYPTLLPWSEDIPDGCRRTPADEGAISVRRR